MAINIVFMQVLHDPLADLFVRSVRRLMPESHIVQCTDNQTGIIDGVDRVYRHNGDVGNLMNFRLEAFAALSLEGPSVYLDTDMLMFRALDPEQILGGADVAVLKRVFGADELLNTRFLGMDLSEYAGMQIGKVYPYIGCFALMRSNEFWKECERVMKALPKKFLFWYGDQEAIREVVEARRFNVKEVKESDYACLPEYIDEAAPPFIAHFKGVKRKAMMEPIYRKLLQTTEQ